MFDKMNKLFKYQEDSRCQSKDITETLGNNPCQYVGVVIFYVLFNPGLNWTRNRLSMVSKFKNFRLGFFSGVGWFTLCSL